MSKRAWSNETAKEYPDPKRAKKEGVNEQDPPPSRVIHCRNVPDGCREGDLVGAVQTFGRVSYATMMPRSRQALVEFETVEAAIALKDYAANNELPVLGRPVFFNYSVSTNIKRFAQDVQNPGPNERPARFDAYESGQYERGAAAVGGSPGGGRGGGMSSRGGHAGGNSGGHPEEQFYGGATYGGPRSERPHREYGPNKILLLTVNNPLYPITVNVLHTICREHGEVQRIAIFHKSGVQALVEFANVDQAGRAKTELHGADIYAGCCTLSIEFSKADRVNVAVNSDDSWDFTTPEPSGRGPPMRRAPLQPTPQGGREDFGGRDERFYGEGRGGRGGGYNAGGDGGREGFRGGHHGPGRGGYEEDYRQGGGFDQNGGGGAVLMVYNLDSERVNCDRLFNIICAYGNITRIKVFVKKTGAAMVQMERRDGAQNAIKHLNGAPFMGRELQISFSRHDTIEDRGLVGQLPDGTPAVVDYANSRNNRFYSAEQSRKNHMINPTRVLHFFNAYAEINEDDIRQVFATSNAPVPIHVTLFDKKGGGLVRTTGLVEFMDEAVALEAMAVCNHKSIYAPGGQSFLFKLAFSQSAPKGIKE